MLVICYLTYAKNASENKYLPYLNRSLLFLEIQFKFIKLQFSVVIIAFTFTTR